MNSVDIKTARYVLKLNQTDFAALLGWTTKRNIISLENGDKEVTVQTALAIECLLRRADKFDMFNTVSGIPSDVEKQKELAEKALSENQKMTIKITDSLCALCFSEYAIKENWNDSGDEFEIAFEDYRHVAVSKKHFLEYQFQYTDFAVELEEKYEEALDWLRDEQAEAIEELLENAGHND